MKLFPKLVLAISLLILVQAFTTGVLVSRSVRSSNREDSLVELRKESSVMQNNFHSWKRHLWKQLVRIQTMDTTPSRENLTLSMRSSNVDAVIVRSGAEVFTIEAISTTGDFVLPSADALLVFYPHPYIRLYRIDGQFYMVGAISLKEYSPVKDVFLIKHINGSFLRNIAFNNRGALFFHTDQEILVSDIPNEQLPADSLHNGQESAYTEQLDLILKGTSYNVASAKCGVTGYPGQEEIVYLSSVLSNEPFSRRIQDVEKAVLTVSLAAMLITVFLSMLISRGITKPVILLARAMEDLKSGNFGVRLRNPPGDEIGILLRGFNDMSETLSQDQLAIERSLHEITFLNMYNEKVINSIRAAIVVVNESRTIEKSNHFFQTQFPEAEKGSLPFDSSVLNEIDQIVRGRKEFHIQRFRGKDQRVYELKIYPLQRDSRNGGVKNLAVLLLEDISEKNAYEEKIFQAEKLTSVSMLSAGIAHEINNPLSSILTNVQNLIYDEQDEESLDTLRLVENETLRIARIIRDLLDFTSQEQNETISVNPLSAAEEVIRLIQHAGHARGRGISPLKIECPFSPGSVTISKGELMQVFINLIQNALHASRGEDPVVLRFGREESGFLTISVRDRGEGIPDELLTRVFDPFFTTKANGEGTGLGLSVVYGIIMKYNGTIRIDSTPGRGTEVIFQLPLEGSL